MNVKTWDEFVGHPDVSDVMESIGLGPRSQYSDGRLGEESLTLRVEFTHTEGGPCVYENCYYIGAHGSPLWAAPDAHTAMLEDIRARVVSWVSRPSWPKCEEDDA